MSEKQTHSWVVTHKGWLLLCPLWLAEMESDAPVPIPRGVPDWWFSFNVWVNGGIQWIIWLLEPDAVGFLFHRVRELDEAKVIEVLAEE